ncbi:MAG: undecaprenyldiphospho-muramoylpentapeptide beta-N-acetylglucosaminyltransferase [Chloroflexi bacterium]|nr:undecaprenyldiphospho-muramoylpentapeptide beta-N-acetylglucosaminyltransferase [Chloroflexota bacterium]
MTTIPLRVLLAGGGSGGSATPVLAVGMALRQRQPDAEFLFIGTAAGPERALAEAAGFPFAAVAAGKLRRYLAWQNVVDLGRVPLGVAQAARLVRHFRPHVAFGAGGFASVPPLIAAALSGVPVLIHQQDVEPGLANRLLVPFARRISVTFAASRRYFPARCTAVRGNPVRPDILAGDPERGRARFGLEPQIPTLLVTGGGTGALELNRRVAAAVPLLTHFCQVIHLTGRGRAVPPVQASPRYHAYEFLVEEMKDALAVADLVISRAGLGAISELAALGKPMVLVPMPGSHQLANARVVAQAGAARVIDQASLTPERLADLVRGLLADAPGRAALGAAARRLLPADAADRIATDLQALASPAWLKARRGA